MFYGRPDGESLTSGALVRNAPGFTTSATADVCRARGAGRCLNNARSRVQGAEEPVFVLRRSATRPPSENGVMDAPIPLGVGRPSFPSLAVVNHSPVSQDSPKRRLISAWHDQKTTDGTIQTSRSRVRLCVLMISAHIRPSVECFAVENGSFHGDSYIAEGR